MLPISREAWNNISNVFIQRKSVAERAWWKDKWKNKPILQTPNIPLLLNWMFRPAKPKFQHRGSKTRCSSRMFDLTLASVGLLRNDDESESKLNKVRTEWMLHYGAALLHQFCKRWGHLSVHKPSSLMLPQVWLPPATSRLQAKRCHLARAEFVRGRFGRWNSPRQTGTQLRRKWNKQENFF